MNRRDYFAAQALNAMISRGIAGDDVTLAKNAYEYADAMIAASPPSADALRDSAYSIAQTIEGYLLSELHLAEAWRRLDNDARNRMMDGFTNAAQRQIFRYFKPGTP